MKFRYARKRVLRAVLGIAAMASVTHGTMAYEPPIGIPDPGGSDPKSGASYGWEGLHPLETAAPLAPDDWGATVDRFYYVNPSHPNATDSGNSNGYPSRPRITMPVTLPAGSSVLLAGVFTGDLGSIRSNCTRELPCWIRGQSLEQMPVVSGNLTLVDSAYVFVEGLNFNGGVAGALGITGNSHNIVVRDNRITNREHPVSGAASGLSARPGHGEVMENIVFYRNHFEALGDLNVENDQDFHAMSASLWGRDDNSGSELRNMWVLDNFCTEISGDCFQITGFHARNSLGYQRLHHVYVGRNTSFNNRQGGVGVKEASDIIISQNLSHSYEGDGAGNAGGCFGYQYDKRNVWFIFNECYNSVFGIRQSDTGDGTQGEDVYMVGNLIYNVRPAADNTSYLPAHIWGQGVGIALWHGNLDRHIVDNTIYSTKAGIHANFRGGDVDVSGNIIANIGPDDGNTFFRFGLVSRSDNPKEYVTLDYNLFFDGVRQQYYSEQDGTGNMRSIEEVQVDSTYCQESCEFADPLFVNPTIDPQTRDFRLQAGSPAIGANIKHPVYDRFEELYGLNIYKDFDGNDRHPTNPSLGAFEYVDETDSFDPEKLQVKIKYPTKNPVYSYGSSMEAIQFGGHASYEQETITVDWVLAQCESDCAEEVADGQGYVQITGSTQTSSVVDYPQNNWHVSSQAIFPGRNVLLISAVHPNGQRKVTSMIIEPDQSQPVDEQPPVIDVSSPVISGDLISLTNSQSVVLSGQVSDNVGLNSMGWSCLSGCVGSGSLNVNGVSSAWEVRVDDLRYGLNRILLSADDQSDNAASRVISIQVADTQSPSLQIQQASVSLSGSVSDNTQVASVTWECVAGCSGGGDAVLSGQGWNIERIVLGEAGGRIRITAVDTQGNQSDEDFVITP